MHPAWEGGVRQNVNEAVFLEKMQVDCRWENAASPGRQAKKNLAATKVARFFYNKL
jgi:hypothetical protein